MSGNGKNVIVGPWRSRRWAQPLVEKIARDRLPTCKKVARDKLASFKA